LYLKGEIIIIEIYRFFCGKFIDFFAGIGGFREGLERNGFECVGWCEIDKFKQQRRMV